MNKESKVFNLVLLFKLINGTQANLIADFEKWRDSYIIILARTNRSKLVVSNQHSVFCHAYIIFVLYDENNGTSK